MKTKRPATPPGETVMHSVFFYEAFEEEAAALKRLLPSGLTAGFTGKTVQETGDIDPPSKIISVRTQSVIPPGWAYGLSGILSRSTGYDHMSRYIDKAGKDLSCGHLPLYCSRAVAEQAMLMWMMLLRKMPAQQKQFLSFVRDGLSGAECRGKTLAVVGVGNIGSEVAKIGIGLEMKVLGVDIVERHTFLNYAHINEALANADIIVCAMNLTPENTAYFHRDRLLKAKRGAIFINIARGELSPSKDLLFLVENGHISGIGIDVFENESCLAASLRNGVQSEKSEIEATMKLSGLPNVIFTPHNAFNTIEAVERKASQSVEQVVYFIKHNRFLWPVPI